MKLVIFGLTVSSSWGNGHATIWRGLLTALAGRGHRVVFFERDVPYYAMNRDLTEIPGGTLAFYTDWDSVRREAEEHLRDADAAIVTSYCPDGIAATELVLDSPVPLKLFYDLDTPVTLAQLRDEGSVSYIGPSGLGGFDLVLSYTGGGALDELRTRLGARRVLPLYGSVDPDVHRPVAPVEQYGADLSYIGTYAADRQKALEALFIEPARLLPERRFVIAGAQYPQNFPWTENIWFVRHVPPSDHCAFYSSCRLTLNVTRKAMAEMGWCPSGRLFEAAASGAPILSDWWPGLDDFFEPGSEILVARDTQSSIAAVCLSDAELRGVARRARERTLDQHTAWHRADDLEKALETGTDSRPRPLAQTPVGAPA